MGLGLIELEGGRDEGDEVGLEVVYVGDVG